MTHVPPNEIRTVEVWGGTGTPQLLDQFHYNPIVGWPPAKPEWFDAGLPLTFIDIGPTEEMDRQYDALPPYEEGAQWQMDSELRRQLRFYQ